MADSFVEKNKLDEKNYILVFIARAEGRVLVETGGWSPGEQRQLEAALQDSLQESMKNGGLSDAFLQMAEDADYMVRNIIGFPSS